MKLASLFGFPFLSEIHLPIYCILIIWKSVKRHFLEFCPSVQSSSSRWKIWSIPESATLPKLSCVSLLGIFQIVELEKRFWVLAAKNKDKSNRIDINSLKQLVSPPMPTGLTTAFFQALDENQDGHIDFKELCCGVSAACRGPELERQKCKKA